MTATGGYSLQEALPGEASYIIPAPLLPRLLELNDLQRGQAAAVPGRDDWPAPVVAPVLHGGPGFCLLEPLRAYSSVTAELLRTLQGMVAAHLDDPFETGDIVHDDFQGSNILVHEGRIGGVVDWERCCRSDRAFDLATLFYYSHEAYDDPAPREWLWRQALARCGPAALAWIMHDGCSGRERPPGSAGFQPAPVA